MENPSRKRNSSSCGGKFSFPATITTPDSQESDDQFEFGFVTAPGSPNSPADHLFLNGKLLPHVFPVHQTPSNYSYSRSTSRTSSISASSSRGSLMSSRSNSTNSRSSNCSSARTSTSEAAPKKRSVLADDHGNIIPGRNSLRKERNNNRPPHVGLNSLYGSSQRWQLMAAVPVLKHQGSRSRKVDQVLERKGSKKSRGEDEDCRSGGKLGFGRRILKSLVSACQECHAIKTANIECY